MSDLDETRTEIISAITNNGFSVTEPIKDAIDDLISLIDEESEEDEDFDEEDD